MHLGASTYASVVVLAYWGVAKADRKYKNMRRLDALIGKEAG
jgi:hypothetical protein